MPGSKARHPLFAQLRLPTGPTSARDDHEHGSTWILMTGPEGNELCVCDGGAAS